MYETVKIVKGHEIYRMKNTQRFYWVDINKHSRVNFRTIKAAAEFIETNF